jgi:hypothetical protein
MDTISHGLWGALSFGRKNKKIFILAFLIGALPDIIAIGWQFLTQFSGSVALRTPALETIPSYIYDLYNITHSLVISVILFAILFLIFRDKSIPFLAWPLHVLFDIPSHSLNFFPTPYLWPFETPFFDGIPWVTPWVFFLNWAILIVLYVIWKYIPLGKIRIKF